MHFTTKLCEKRKKMETGNSKIHDALIPKDNTTRWLNSAYYHVWEWGLSSSSVQSSVSCRQKVSKPSYSHFAKAFACPSISFLLVLLKLGLFLNWQPHTVRQDYHRSKSAWLNIRKKKTFVFLWVFFLLNVSLQKSWFKTMARSYCTHWDMHTELTQCANWGFLKCVANILLQHYNYSTKQHSARFHGHTCTSLNRLQTFSPLTEATKSQQEKRNTFCFVKPLGRNYNHDCGKKTVPDDIGKWGDEKT